MRFGIDDLHRVVIWEGKVDPYMAIVRLRHDKNRLAMHRIFPVNCQVFMSITSTSLRPIAGKKA